MKELKQQHVFVKMCSKLGKKFTETFQLLNLVYGEDGERVFLTKKRMNELFKDQGVGFIFIGKALSIMNLYNVVRW
jgi:hypothetical protein